MKRINPASNYAQSRFLIEHGVSSEHADFMILFSKTDNGNIREMIEVAPGGKWPGTFFTDKTGGRRTSYPSFSCSSLMYWYITKNDDRNKMFNEMTEQHDGSDYDIFDWFCKILEKFPENG